MAAAIQLSFTLRTSTQCNTVHLYGSWDMYQNSLPLSRDPQVHGGGGWKGTFRFQGSTIKRGHRYWYYYALDGYQFVHDHLKDSCIEPTTGRSLNILDVPSSTSTSSAKQKPLPRTRIDTVAANSHRSGKKTSTPVRIKRNSRNTPDDIPLGRPVSPSMIMSPQPRRKNPPAYLAAADAELSTNITVEKLSQQFAKYATVSHRPNGKRYSTSSFDDSSDIDSDASSDVPSLVDTPNSGLSCSPDTPGAFPVSARKGKGSSLHSFPRSAHSTHSRTSPVGSIVSPTTSISNNSTLSSGYDSSPAVTNTTPATSPASSAFSRRSPGSSPKTRSQLSSGRRRTSSTSSASSGGGGKSAAAAHTRAPSTNSSSSKSSRSRCECERYGVTRKGSRIRLDCGGSRCGYASTSPPVRDCNSAPSDDDSYICSSSIASSPPAGTDPADFVEDRKSVV